MADGISTEVVVTRKVVDGWVLYTCPKLPGLFVAGKDNKETFEDIPRSIQLLMKLENNVDCDVTHVISYEDLIAGLGLSDMAKAAVQARTEEMMKSSDFAFAIHPVAAAHDCA